MVKYLVGIIAVGIIAAFTGSPASAEDPLADHRSCVANREANSAVDRTGRTTLEKSWEVQGRGIPMDLFGESIVTYPWCGHSFKPGSVTDPRGGWVGVAYNDNRMSTMILWFKNSDNQGVVTTDA